MKCLFYVTFSRFEYFSLVIETRYICGEIQSSQIMPLKIQLQVKRFQQWSGCNSSQAHLTMIWMWKDNWLIKYFQLDSNTLISRFKNTDYKYILNLYFLMITIYCVLFQGTPIKDVEVPDSALKSLILQKHCDYIAAYGAKKEDYVWIVIEELGFLSCLLK